MTISHILQQRQYVGVQNNLRIEADRTVIKNLSKNKFTKNEIPTPHSAFCRIDDFITYIDHEKNYVLYNIRSNRRFWSHKIEGAWTSIKMSLSCTLYLVCVKTFFQKSSIEIVSKKGIQKVIENCSKETIVIPFKDCFVYLEKDSYIRKMDFQGKELRKIQLELPSFTSVSFPCRLSERLLTLIKNQADLYLGLLYYDGLTNTQRTFLFEEPRTAVFSVLTKNNRLIDVVNSPTQFIFHIIDIVTGEKTEISTPLQGQLQALAVDDEFFLFVIGKEDSNSFYRMDLETNKIQLIKDFSGGSQISISVDKYSIELIRKVNDIFHVTLLDAATFETYAEVEFDKYPHFLNGIMIFSRPGFFETRNYF